MDAAAGIFYANCMMEILFGAAPERMRGIHTGHWPLYMERARTRVIGAVLVEPFAVCKAGSEFPAAAAGSAIKYTEAGHVRLACRRVDATRPRVGQRTVENRRSHVM